MGSIGANIRRIRKERHLSQERLAELAGLNEKSMYFYETEKRHIPSDYLAAIADALGVSVDELCGKTKEMTTAEELRARIDRAVQAVLMDYEIISK